MGRKIRHPYIIPDRKDGVLDAFFKDAGPDILSFFEGLGDNPMLLFRHAYRFPPGYVSPDELRTSVLDYLALTADDIAEGKDLRAELGAGGVELVSVFQILAEAGLPFYVLDEGFIDMVMATSLPDNGEFDLFGDYKPPFQACMFLLPESRFGSANAVTYAMVIPDLESRVPKDAYFGIVVHLSESKRNGERDSGTVMPGLWLEYGKTKAEDLYLDSSPETAYSAPNGDVLEIDDDDHFFISHSREFLVKLFAVLNAEPELLIPEKVVRKVKKTGRKIAEYPRSWAPPKLWKKSSAVGTGEGKRHVHPHYRRGHVRRQHYGKGGKSVKLVWIRPVLVNKKLEENNDEQD